MPRSCRPFYLSASVDGRGTDIGSGPRAKDGGMSICITQRDEGAIRTAFTIESSSYVNSDGDTMLKTHVCDCTGRVIGEFTTKY